MSNESNKLDTLWYTRCAVPTPLSIAVQSGWIDQEFARDGIKIKSLRESTKPTDYSSHFDHHLPHSFRQGGSVPPIWARANGQQTKVIGLTWTDEYQSIISLADSGIKNLKDLKGRRIGIPKHENSIDHNRASALRAFTVALNTESLNLNDVELIDLPDSAYVTVNDVERPGGAGRANHSYVSEVYALVRGEVDAVYVKDVRGAEVTHLLGAHIVFDLGFHPDPFIRISNCSPRPLTVNADTIDLYPDIVSRFIRQVVKAGEWARKHPEETVTMIARETGWSEDWVRRVFGPNIHNSLRLDLSEASIKGIDIFKDFLFEHDFLKENFEINTWIDYRPLDSIKADVISINR